MAQQVFEVSNFGRYGDARNNTLFTDAQEARNYAVRVAHAFARSDDDFQIERLDDGTIRIEAGVQVAMYAKDIHESAGDVEIPEFCPNG